MRTTSRLQRIRGFTLVEAMIASIVLAFCVLGICGTLISAMQNQNAAQSQGDASSAATANMESLAARSLDDISSSSGHAPSETLDSSFLTDSDDAEVSGHVNYIQRASSQGSRELAVIQVTAKTANGQSVTLYRLSTRTEMP